MIKYDPKKNQTILDKIQAPVDIPIVKDGVIDFDIWKPQAPKVLFVLKDTNQHRGSLIQLLSEPYHEDHRPEITNHNKRTRKIRSDLRYTWLNISRWAFGIERIWDNNPILDWKEIDNKSEWYQEEQDYLGWMNELKKIAVINLKKTPGKEAAKPAELQNAYDDYGDLLWKQINLIDPNVIIFCSVSNYIVTDEIISGLRTNWEKTKQGFSYFETHKKLFIQYWHPNARYPHNMMFFSLMNIISELKDVYKL
ncbi:hypothetical protein ACFL4H_02185 [Candidatus Neomarinimicrobiota bacterium]